MRSLFAADKPPALGHNPVLKIDRGLISFNKSEHERIRIVLKIYVLRLCVFALSS
jgi:hypothetical protein